MGCIKLGIPKPTNLRKKQAVAAAGQSQLMRMYEDLFGTVRLRVAQLLISQSDFMERGHWSNVKHTVLECLELGVVPIINENDSTNTEELRFGDNDNLAALTSVQLEADWLFVFTDVDYLYSANPKVDPSAKPLNVVEEPWALKVDTSGSSSMGTGGMTTKILAARMVTSAGIKCGLIHGAHCERLHSFLKYVHTTDAGDRSGGFQPPEGTYFVAMDVANKNVSENRRWILSLPVSGEVVVDDGAARAVAKHENLLPAGIVSIQGSFAGCEAIAIKHKGGEVARAIVNLSADDLAKIKGKHSSEFEDILGFSVRPEACDRSNIIVTTGSEK
eukprot:gnl/TRDRNA2_/TRDRNA2_86208_c0_seq1.p1 gnl/TRDRNA2_/TRDRNA2_86208_c0~~gnl/TRDRNA2_/TRDRNA2_86208_c0_seq1.p1  ORF type:complete len:374 (+),score=64.40 gnl/TRDRNA2_/TRDRNA2_86208_c0_seq1:131-1123(+)